MTPDTGKEEIMTRRYPEYLYLMEHREDENGRVSRRSIVGRFPYTINRNGVVDSWHNDIIRRIREESEAYVEGSEEGSGSVSDNSSYVLDFTMCAEPACKWVLELVPSGMNQETERLINEGKA